MTSMPPQQTFFMRPTKKEQKAEVAILFLYLFFFLLWLAGYGLGVFAFETYLLWGFPLWFIISSVVSFVVACLGLRIVIQRNFS